MDKTTLQQALAYIGTEFKKLIEVIDEMHKTIQTKETIEVPPIVIAGLPETNILLKKIIDKKEEEVTITLRVI